LGKCDKRNICGKRQENKRHFWKISKIFVDIEGLKYGREFKGENVIKFVPLFGRRLRDRKLSKYSKSLKMYNVVAGWGTVVKWDWEGQGRIIKWV
jgi:hypothetical protein